MISQAAEQFCADLEALGLVGPEPLRALRQQSRSGAETSAAALAGRLVAAGTLTEYQARAILRGKGQRLVFGEYLLIDRLGAGGMGKVYRAQHRRMKRIVAIKVLPTASHYDAAALRRFQLEVEAAARLTHPNIVIALDAGEARGQHYLIMECIEGDTLAGLVRERGPLPVERAVRCVVDAARGLEYAHSKGVVHRDIKPSNLLMTRDGIVKILDLGLARLDGELPDDPSTTGTGNFLGTVGYVAPEQAADSKRADPRADIYSLGCTLHYLLTGRPPYRGATALETLLAHRDAPIPALGASRADISVGLEQAFRRMLAKAPEHRYATMAAAREALEPSLMAGANLLPAFSATGYCEPPPLVPATPGPRPAPVPLPFAPATAATARAARPALGQTAQDATSLPPTRRRRRPPRRQTHLLSIAIIVALLATIVVLFPRYGQSLRAIFETAPEHSVKQISTRPPEHEALAPVALDRPTRPNPPRPRVATPQELAGPPVRSTATAKPAAPAEPAAPDARAVAAAKATLRARYGKDFDAANTPWRKAQLAKELVKQVAKAGDAIEQFAQSQLALEQAAAAVDVDTALAAAAAGARRFGQDFLRAKVAAVVACADGLTAMKQSKDVWQAAQGDVLACSLADRAMTLNAEAVAADRYAAAYRLTAKVRDTLAAAGESSLEAQWTEILARNDRQWKLYQDLPPPTAAAAAEQGKIGRFLCYYKQHWPQGLAHLARGDEPAVQNLALLEKTDPASVDDHLRLAAGWWDIADRAEGMARESIRRHAADWYHRALRSLPQGETREAIELRLTEAGLDAVSQAIRATAEWLAKHQQDDGSWTFALAPAGNNQSVVAATAMALRALFAAAGVTPDAAQQRALRTGLAYLRKQGSNGDFRGDKQPSMYVQAVAAIALCDASIRVKDAKLHKEAQDAIQFIINSQDTNGGGWRYQPGEAGDVSATGWQLVALQSGREAHLAASYPRASRGVRVFLDARTKDGGLSYSYNPELSTPNRRITSVALVCRALLRGRPFDAKDGDLFGRNALAATVRIGQDGPSANDPYFNYYATRLLQLQAGESWKPWRRAMSQRLLASQETVGDAAGSWFPGWGGDAADSGSTLLAAAAGRLGVTAICLLTLADCALGRVD